MPPARAAAPVKVGSKLDTEAALLGTIILQLLKAGGIPTESRLRLGPTKILRAALLSGEVDIYPEYTGNGAFFFNKESDPAWKNPKAGYDLVRSLDADANHLVWLPPAPANNTWGIAVNGAVAAKQKLVTMEDFGRWAASGGDVKLAASAEFVESPAALPAFQTAYDFQLRADRLVVLAGGRHRGDRARGRRRHLRRQCRHGLRHRRRHRRPRVATDDRHQERATGL